MDILILSSHQCWGCVAEVEAESVNQEVSWIWVSLLLWLQLVHHRFQWMVAVTVCVWSGTWGARGVF